MAIRLGEDELLRVLVVSLCWPATDDMQGNGAKHEMLQQEGRLGLAPLTLHMVARAASCGSVK